jgi:hypothetical protein
MSATAHAQLPAPGSTYHVLFASSELFRTTSSTAIPPPSFRFGSIAAADYQMTLSAIFAQLPGTQAWDGISPVYRSILSTSGDNASSRLAVAGPVFNTHGTRLADSHAELFDGNLYAAVGYDEYCQAIVSYSDVWTGSISTGIWAGFSCGTWNSTFSGSGRVGSTIHANFQWIDASTDKSCSQSARLYGLSSALTAPQGGLQRLGYGR